LSQVDLKIDYCSYEAAKYAVEHWHYSKCLPGAGSIKFGVWENDVFIGCVIYSRGANKNINRPYGLDSNEVCELARVALNKHKSNVSQIVSYTIRKIKKDFKNMKLIVSYADSDKGHIGKIYQAMNFIYEGLFAKESGIIVNGKLTHRRSVNSKYGTSSLEILKKKFHLNNLAVITGGESINI